MTTASKEEAGLDAGLEIQKQDQPAADGDAVVDLKEGSLCKMGEFRYESTCFDLC